MGEFDSRQAAALRAVRRAGRPITRAELGVALGSARSGVSALVEEMLEAGLLVAEDHGPSTGGRPAQRLAIGADAARIAIVDVGGSRTRVGLADLRGRLLGDAVREMPVELGPEAVMGWAGDEIERLLAVHGRGERLAIVVGLPGPVDFATGFVVSPPIMVGWEGFSTADYLRDRFDAPVVIDNDVNLIALAEQRINHPNSNLLLVIKLGTGIGGGIVIDGRVLRGARGGAGDIGHTQATPEADALCRCGHRGCVESAAGGWALVQELQAKGHAVRTTTDVATLAREGNVDAVAAVRRAAGLVGVAAANAVSLLNPDTVVIAGELLGAGEQVLAMIREGVYQRSLPLATHNVAITISNLGPLVGLRGGAELGCDLIVGDLIADQSLDVA